MTGKSDCKKTIRLAGVLTLSGLLVIAVVSWWLVGSPLAPRGSRHVSILSLHGAGWEGSWIHKLSFTNEWVATTPDDRKIFLLDSSCTKLGPLLVIYGAHQME